MIRFLIDAQLPPGLAHRLSERGYPADHVNRVSLGAKSDIDIWRYATRTGATLITKDEDFVALLAASRTDRRSCGFALATSAITHYGARSSHSSMKSFRH
jgi:predicted nuclease of predicted toxin-antitoxin system